MVSLLTKAASAKATASRPQTVSTAAAWKRMASAGRPGRNRLILMVLARRKYGRKLRKRMRGFLSACDFPSQGRSRDLKVRDQEVGYIDNAGFDVQVFHSLSKIQIFIQIPMPANSGGGLERELLELTEAARPGLSGVIVAAAGPGSRWLDRWSPGW